LPRTTVPTAGRRGPEGRGMEIVGVFEDFDEEGAERIGPEILAQRLEFEMWVPGPREVVEAEPRICPGRAIVLWNSDDAMN